MSDQRSSSFDPARVAVIAKNYRFSLQGALSDDEAMYCSACGFASRFDGTPVFAWIRRRPEIAPITIELCDICHAAASTA